MTTIKDHIDAGRYPRDDKGRALVPHSEGGLVTVFATNGTDDFPIVGWRFGIKSGPDCWSRDASCLLPPPPRKVKVTRWGVIAPRGFIGTWDNPKQAHADANINSGSFVVELVGEYEEPWS